MTTIKDIAKIARVSKATVSKVINRHPGVKEETKRNVLRVMRENNFWPNSIARSLSTSKSYTIGIFDPGRLNNFFFREVFEGIERELGMKGYDILYFTDKKWDGSWVNFGYTEISKNRSVDGVILMGFGRIDMTEFQDLLHSDMPAVFIDLDLVGKNASYVISDNFNGARSAIRYLCGLGHEKIAMITGHNGFKVARDRFFGFQSAIDEFKLKYNPDWVFYGEYQMEVGYKSMEKILTMKQKPTAIFAEDILAIGAIRSINDHGLRVPEDFSVIGFDNIELSKHYDLTTIHQEKFYLGEAASQLLLKIIEKKNSTPVILQTRLVERSTCRRITG